MKCNAETVSVLFVSSVCGKAMEYLTNLKTERSGKRVDTEVLDEGMSGLSDSVFSSLDLKHEAPR